MTNMIEKAARAAARDYIESEPLYTLGTNTIDEEVDLIWPEYVPEVRSVLLAIRVPDEAMLVALDNTPDKEWRTGTDREFWADLWSIMIDSILKEGT